MHKTFPKTVGQFIKKFSKPYRPHFIVMILINTFAASYIVLQPYVLKKLIDAVTLTLGHELLIQAALWPAAILILLTILNNLAWRLSNYVSLKSLPNLIADIIDEASDYLHGHSFKFFQDNLSGAIGQKISDLSYIIGDLVINCRALLQQSLTIVSAIFIAAIVNPAFALVFFVWALLFIKLAFYFSKGIEPFSKVYAESRSRVAGNIVDSFVNAMNVIIFARGVYEQAHLRSALTEMVIKDTAVQTQLMRYAFIMSSLTILAEAIMIMLLLYFGSKDMLTVGDFALMFMLTLSVLNYVWNFTDTLFKVSEKTGIFKQALGFIATQHDIVDPENAVPLKVKTGKIVFSRVQFFYNESQKLFEDKTLVIKDREKVGLVGYSGSGKSTFVNLITRTFDIQSGEILIDNQSIRSVTLQSLRENIAFIAQDPTLFHRTLMDNIRYGKLKATDEEVIEAAKKAYVDEFAMELPNGYQTCVGERGVKLSGGQRQRIAIARAILKDAPILILDEATSSLDSVTESLIQQSLQCAMNNKTVIVIAHRLSTIKAMDRILVFNKGKVVEEGTHDYLLEHGKIYPNLWQVQQGFLSA